MINHRMTPMTESGLLSAITVIMALIAVYLPVLGMAAALLWPLPVVVLVVRHGLRWGVMAAVVSAVIMAILIEPTLAARMLIAFAPVGLMLGFGYRRGWSAVRVFAAVLGTSIAAKILALLLVLALTNINPLDMQVDMLKDSFSTSADIYRSMNVDEAQLAVMEQDFDKSMQLVSLLMPLVVIMMGFLDAFVNFVVANRVLRRLGHRVPELVPFTEWRLPQAVLYLFGFALVGMYWGGSREIPLLYQISFNANMFAMFIGIVQGVSLLWYAADRWHLGKAVRFCVLAFILLNGILAQIVAFTGLFDMLFDYRRRFGQDDKGGMK